MSLESLESSWTTNHIAGQCCLRKAQLDLATLLNMGNTLPKDQFIHVRPAFMPKHSTPYHRLREFQCLTISVPTRCHHPNRPHTLQTSNLTSFRNPKSSNSTHGAPYLITAQMACTSHLRPNAWYPTST